VKHTFLATLFAAAIALPAYSADYTIMAPAAPGGGWDQTARSLQTVLQQEGISGNVQVQNIPGAGGTIGLAQFTSQNSGNPNALIVGGYVMVGAILTNKSPVTLKDVTPIARLTGEYEAIVVPAASDIKTMGDLVAKLKAEPGAVSWGGGSAGGTDHIAVGLIAKAAGVDPTKVNYVSYDGGGELLPALLGEKVSFGASGVGEFIDQIEAGQLRVLAVSSEQRVPAVDAPTLKESGVDLAFANWRGVVAPPGISDADKQALVSALDKMHTSAGWKEALTSRGWTDAYLSGEGFTTFLKEQDQRVADVLTKLGLA